MFEGHCAFAVVDPCNAEAVDVEGTCKIVYHVDESAAGEHHTVHTTFEGTGSGDQRNTHRFMKVGNTPYDAPIEIDNGARVLVQPFHITGASA